MNRTILSKNFNKGTFSVGAPPVKVQLWYLVSLVCFRSGLIPFSTVLVLILRAFGSKIGKYVRIKPGAYIRYPWKFEMGDHSWLADCYVDNLDHVILGKNVCVSQGAMLLTGNHDFTKPEFDLITKPIVLEDGVWIGAKSVVCPGVRANSHAVLTVGSIATKDLEAYSIYRGHPAYKIKNRELGKNTGIPAFDFQEMEMAFI